MADTNNKFSLFGFTISRQKSEEDSAVQKSFAPQTNDDGALTITSAAYYGTYVDLDGTAKNEVELISRYREMAMQPEIESAIDDIVNEAICQDDDGKTIAIVLDNLKQPDKIKELRYIDPRKLRKVREMKRKKDERTGVDVVDTVNEYYIYNDKVVTGTSSNFGPVGVRITTDSIISVVSGLMDSRRAAVLSYLHKAIKPLNQLRMIEDAIVIYRISRAPERRIFYIDVGNLPKLKAEQYLRDIMVKYKNKVVYDANTGEVRDDRKYLSMMEDYWLPRREGGKGTEITTLPGGQNLGELEDIKYFQRKLYGALSVPISRLEPDQGFSLGRSAEVTRDELKFSKFVERMRIKFSEVFDQTLRVQCVLKGICTEEEWNEFKEQIHYDFIKDNNFSELKEAELITNRLQLLSSVDAYTGVYFSQAWIQRNVLRLSDDEIKEMQSEIDKEKKDGRGMPTDILNQMMLPELGLADPAQPAPPSKPAKPASNKEEINSDINKLIMEIKNDR